MDAILDMILNGPLGQSLTEFAKSEVAKMTFAFLIAARLHRNWVKKDMSEQFAQLRSAIDHVAQILGRRIDTIEERVEKIEGK